MNIEINERFTAYYLIFMETDLKRKHQTHILGSYKVFQKCHCGLTKMVLKTCISSIYKEMQTPLPKQERGHTIGGT